MVNQPEAPTYDVGVYEWELTDPVQGGVGGVANLPILNLSNRTAWLKQRIDSLSNGTLIPPTVAPLDSPVFTGSTTAPDVAAGDNSNRIANTRFVQTAKSGIALVSVPPGATSVTLTQPQWGVGILEIQGTLSNNVIIIFPNKTGAWIVRNNTTGAFTVFCQTAAGSGVAFDDGYVDRSVWCDGTNIYWQHDPFKLATSGVSPGIYTYPNITVGADGRITRASSLPAVSTFNARTGSVTLSLADVLTALAFTPVQQGGGAAQGANKMFLGWDGGQPRLQVDGIDLGQIAMRSNFNLTVLGTDIFIVNIPMQTGTTLYIQMGVASVPVTSGTQSTTFNLPVTYPTSHIGAIAGYLGNIPPPGGSISAQPTTVSQITITANTTFTVTLGVVYLSFGF